MKRPLQYEKQSRRDIVRKKNKVLGAAVLAHL